MEPNQQEIEAVGEALIFINQYEYTEPQLEWLNGYLQSYAKNYSDDECGAAFEEEEEFVQAAKVLHEFATKYAANTEIYEELKMELDDILYNLNDSSTNMTF